MSHLPKPTEVLAILCSDIHLSHKPPIGRSAEPNWYAAMSRQLERLQSLQEKHRCPVICAGDLFDRWNSPPELINFAIRNLPEQFYAIPGQHDLPNHRIEDIKRSAYWTLVEAGVVRHLNGTEEFDNLIVDAYPWGVDVDICRHNAKRICLVVVHAYCWRNKAGSYPGAPKENKVNEWKKRLKGYDAAVFGDNHCGFYDKASNIFNCGTFMRRKVDDPLETYVGALLSSGEIYLLTLDNSQDKWVERPEGLRGLEREWELDDFIQDLSQLESRSFDFEERLLRFCHDNRVKSEVVDLIQGALEAGE